MTALTCPPMHGDVANLARILLTYAPNLRATAADHFIERAMIAHRHVQTYRKVHPGGFGNGSIMAAVRNFALNPENNRPLPPEPFFSDAEYLDCFGIAIEALKRLAEMERCAGRDAMEAAE